MTAFYRLSLIMYRCGCYNVIVYALSCLPMSGDCKKPPVHREERLGCRGSVMSAYVRTDRSRSDVEPPGARTQTAITDSAGAGHKVKQIKGHPILGENSTRKARPPPTQRLLVDTLPALPALPAPPTHRLSHHVPIGVFDIYTQCRRAYSWPLAASEVESHCQCRVQWCGNLSR